MRPDAEVIRARPLNFFRQGWAVCVWPEVYDGQASRKRPRDLVLPTV
jgi:hypothetical protein